MSDTKPSRTASGTVARSAEGFPVIPGYTIQRELGRGGMAVVYLAKEHDPERDVAIKTIRPEFARDEGFLTRFKAERNWLAELGGHASILPIFAVRVVDDCPYIVMMYAPGGSLREKIKERVLPVADRLRIIKTLARALKFAHDRAEPICHLDIKPENILFSDGKPLLADFGVARKIVSLTGEQGKGTRVGDPDYWAPEQERGSPCTASDIYSLGLVYFEVLANKRPDVSCIRGGADRDELIKELAPEFRSTDGPLIARCLAFKASDRPTAGDLLVALEERTKPTTSNLPIVIATFLVLVAIAWSVWQVPDVQEPVRAWVDRTFKTTYPIRFSLEPPAGRIWVDGREAPFRAVDLIEGEHSVAAVADNYVGQYRQLSVPPSAGNPSKGFNLQRRPPITDDEYLAFTKAGMDSAPTVGASEPQWVDATLANLALLDRQNSADADADAFQESIKGLKVLAAAGDVVAQTTLFYAAFEGLPVGSQSVELLPGLDMASAKGYGLATVLRALYTLSEVRSQDKPMAQIAEAKAQLLELLERIEKQGLPQTAGQLRAVLAAWEQSVPAGG